MSKSPRSVTRKVRGEAKRVASVDAWVQKVAGQFLVGFRLPGSALDDLVSEGRLGALYAARKFDPSRGVTFMTYATYWIKCMIRKWVAENRQSVRVPANQMSRLARAVSDGAIPADTAKGANLRARACALRDIRLDVPFGADGRLPDLVDDAPTPEEILLANEEADLLAAAVGSLDDRRAGCVMEWMGGKGFDKIARESGFSRQRAHQIVKKGVTQAGEFLASQPGAFDVVSISAGRSRRLDEVAA